MKIMKLIKLMLMLSILLFSSCEKEQSGFNNLKEIDTGTDPGLYDIYIYDTHKNTNSRITVTPDKLESILSFSPDGNRIAYYSDSGIYTINIDGSDIKLEISSNYKGKIKWLDDRIELYYFYRGDLYKTTSADDEILQLTNNDFFLGSPSLLSPDKKNIVCTSDGGFSIISLDGEIETISAGVIWSDFDWSNDSKKLVYTKKSNNDYPNLYQYNVDTKAEDQLTYLVKYCRQPRFNSNGENILFVSGVADEGSDLILLQSDGSEKILVHETSISDPCWSPNNDKIAFVNEDNNLVLINANGENYSIVNEIPGACMNPCWSNDSRYIIYYRALFYL